MDVVAGEVLTPTCGDELLLDVVGRLPTPVPPPACGELLVAAPVFGASVLIGFEAAAGAVSERVADIARKLEDALSELLS